MRCNAHILAPVMALAACRSGPYHTIDTVPIVGATPDEEAAIEAELDRLWHAMDVQSVVLRRIEVKDALNGKAIGRHDPFADTIALARRDRLGALQNTLRHELCHALESQLDLLPRDLHKALEDVYVQSGTDGLTYPTRRLRASEGFAELCELGPGALAALQHPQEPDSAAKQMAGWVAATAYVEEPALPEIHPWLDAEMREDDVLLTSLHADGVLAWRSSGMDDARYLSWSGDEVEGPRAVSTIPTRLESGAFWEEAPFPGRPYVMATSRSGAAAAYVRPWLGDRVAVFVRAGPQEPWAWLPGTFANPVFLVRLDGEVVLQWSPEPGVARVARIP